MALPGLCATRLGEAKMARIWEACKQFRDHARASVEMNSVVRLVCTNADDVHSAYVGVLAHYRGSGPRLAAK